MSEYTDRTWQSRDGLKLHFRDYAGRGDRPPVVCLPGLTRNARDFEGLAARLSGEWRVICPDMRGRGDSQYAKDWVSYNPLQYVEDCTALFEQEGISRFVAVGTSLGGLMTMVFAMTAPQMLAGVVLNDIGPEIEADGLDRIRSYVGQGRSFPTWMHAARGLEETQGHAYPDYQLDDWLRMAKRVMTVSGNGRIVFDYDMKIAEPFSQPGGEAGVDMWPGIGGMVGKPVLILRGELSDILSAGTLDKMHARLPGSEAVTLARIGHAPTLDELESTAAIDRLLAKVG